MSPDEAARALTRIAAGLEFALAAAEAETAEAVLAKAKLLSSGPISTAQLRREDHPYARRHGRPQRDPSVINRQSGAFLAAWDVEGPTPYGNGLLTLVFNRDEKAPLLAGGTDRMFARPLPERVAAEEAPDRERRIEAALDALLGG